MNQKIKPTYWCNFLTVDLANYSGVGWVTLWPWMCMHGNCPAYQLDWREGYDWPMCLLYFIKLPWTCSHGKSGEAWEKAWKSKSPWKMKVKVTKSCMTLCDPMNYSSPGSSVHRNSPGENTRVGCHEFLQEIFPTQGLNPGLPHCWWILYQLSH